VEEDGRDLVWDAISTVAARMMKRYEGEGLEITAHRERSVTKWAVTEGLHAGDYWTDVFEPVRQRRLLGGRWQDVQPVQEAAAKIGAFLRARPDLR